MRKNMAKVIEAFKAGKAATGDSKATCSTDGTNVYSYHMLIARRVIVESALLFNGRGSKKVYRHNYCTEHGRELVVQTSLGSEEVIEIIDHGPSRTTNAQINALVVEFGDYSCTKRVSSF